MGENFQEKMNNFKAFQMPYSLVKDDLKVFDKRLSHESTLDSIKSAVVEAFGAKQKLDDVAVHVRTALGASEGGKWFCAVSFDGMKSGMYWSHQEAKLNFDRDGSQYLVSVA